MIALEMCCNVHGPLHGHMEYRFTDIWPTTAKRTKSFIVELLLIQIARLLQSFRDFVGFLLMWQLHNFKCETTADIGLWFSITICCMCKTIYSIEGLTRQLKQPSVCLFTLRIHN